MPPVDIVEDELCGLEAVPAVGKSVSEPVPGDLGRGLALAQAGEGHGVALASHQQAVGRLLNDLRWG